MTDCTLKASFYHERPELLVEIDTDSWIENEFEVDEDLNYLLEQMRANEPARDEGEIMEHFPNYVFQENMLARLYFGDEVWEPSRPTGFYGEGEPVHVFTPNNDNFLSTDVQFVLWVDENGSHAVLRKADAYNGYGCSTAYRVLGDDGTEPFDYAQAFIACDGGEDPNPGQLALDGSKWERCRAVWDHIPGQNGVDQGHGFGNLPNWRGQGDYPAEVGTEGKRGVLVIDHDEHIAFCPVCGSGRLNAGKF